MFSFGRDQRVEKLQEELGAARSAAAVAAAENTFLRERVKSLEERLHQSTESRISEMHTFVDRTLRDSGKLPIHGTIPDLPPPDPQDLQAVPRTAGDSRAEHRRKFLAVNDVRPAILHNLGLTQETSNGQPRDRPAGAEPGEGADHIRDAD